MLIKLRLAEGVKVSSVLGGGHYCTSGVQCLMFIELLQVVNTLAWCH